jgi:hypothetical protein
MQIVPKIRSAQELHMISIRPPIKCLPIQRPGGQLGRIFLIVREDVGQLMGSQASSNPSGSSNETTRARPIRCVPGYMTSAALEPVLRLPALISLMAK